MPDMTQNAKQTSIAAATGVGTVHLDVTDRDQALRFYRDLLGLSPLELDDGLLHFVAGDRELLVLHPGASGPVVGQRTGLYHFAIVVPSRRELARVIARLMAIRYPNSPTDHVLTKADYLWDPDGNGIEVYAETPEDGTWGFEKGGFFARDNDGRLRSGRDPIDLNQLFSELDLQDRLDAPMAQGTKMGHMHLHVRDIDESVRFYSDLMGFDLVGSSSEIGMAFLSAGGYHHHIGLNTWSGKGAPPPPKGTSGLRQFTVELPSGKDLEQAAERLDRGGVDVLGSNAVFTVQDPSENKVRLQVRND